MELHFVKQTFQGLLEPFYFRALPSQLICLIIKKKIFENVSFVSHINCRYIHIFVLYIFKQYDFLGNLGNLTFQF